MKMPIENWLRASERREAEVMVLDGRISVVVRDCGRLFGCGYGDSIEEAAANCMNDAMVRAHGAEEKR